MFHPRWARQKHPSIVNRNMRDILASLPRFDPAPLQVGSEKGGKNVDVSLSLYGLRSGGKWRYHRYIAFFFYGVKKAGIKMMDSDIHPSFNTLFSYFFARDSARMISQPSFRQLRH